MAAPLCRIGFSLHGLSLVLLAAAPVYLHYWCFNSLATDTAAEQERR